MTAKILLIDIETRPIAADVWSLWKQSPGLNQIKADWTILSWAAKWLDGKKVFYADQSGRPDTEDDSDILGALWVLLDEADIVVAHNAARFDVPKINARFIKAGFLPPSPFKVVDTLLIAKKAFKFTSNRLEYLAEYLDVPQKKLKHKKFPGHTLWTEVMKNNPAAWREMKAYNIADVYALEGVYLKLRPWDPLHPSVVVQDDPTVELCPTCGSDHINQKGYRTTNVGKYPRYHCQDCGSWSRGRYTVNTADTRRVILGK